MSQFKENFERGDKDSLDYDDSAFYYFSVAMLTIVLVPSTYVMLIKPVIFGGDFSINYSIKNCACETCVKRMQTRASKYRFSWFDRYFLFKLLSLGFLWFVCYKCFDIVKDLEPLKSFVPNEILGVDIDATVAQVKKAYRGLSREKHPDKNPDNPDAVNEFIQITKAYTVSQCVSAPFP
jgi:translocation protein SEC63